MNATETIQSKAEGKAKERAASTQWEPYLKASLGFRNHWYPALFSSDLSEGEIKPLTLLGEDILLKRVNGQVHAVQDRCLHRGFQLSKKPECYTNNTITCWLHGFTYSFRTGELVTIPSAPDSPLIGKLSLRTYPVEERKGMIFLFVGDMETPTPLSDDVQPGLLDEELCIAPAVRVLVNCNWRIAADTGFDPAHVFIHKEDGFLKAIKLPFPFASIIDRKSGHESVTRAEGPGPKGIIDKLRDELPIFEVEIECDGEKGKVTSMFPPVEEAYEGFQQIVGSMWLPCGLKVDPWPVPGMTHFEWYVPVDEDTHIYTIAWGKRVQSSQEADDFRNEVKTKWKHLGYDQFNATDVIANEACQKFYGEENSWRHEHLCEFDVYTIAWRKLASQYNRGIQKRGQQ